MYDILGNQGSLEVAINSLEISRYKGGNAKLG